MDDLCQGVRERRGVALMGKPRLLVVGAGGYGHSIAEAAELSGLFKVVGFLDDSQSTGATVLQPTVLGSVASMANHLSACDLAIVATGNNAVSEKLIMQLTDAGFQLAKVIHPRAVVSPSALVGLGSAIMAGAIVGTEAYLGVGTIVNCGAVLDHRAKVEDFGHLCVNVSMAGGTFLGRGVWMLAG